MYILVLMQVIIITLIGIVRILSTTFSIACVDSIHQLAQPFAGGSCVPRQDRAQQSSDCIHGRVAALIVVLHAILLLFFVVVDSEAFVHHICGQGIYDLVVICQTQLKINVTRVINTIRKCMMRTCQQDVSINIRRDCLVLLAQDDSAVLDHRILTLSTHFGFDGVLFEPRDYIRVTPQRCISLDEQRTQILHGGWHEWRASEIAVQHDVAGSAISLAMHERVNGHLFEHWRQDHREQHECVLQQFGARQQLVQGRAQVLLVQCVVVRVALEVQCVITL